MADDANLKVRIRNAEGKYLAGDYHRLWFTDDRLKALVLDYHRHQVAQQLEGLKRTTGLALEAEPVDPTEVYEACDRCNRLGMPVHIFFDGTTFLCRDCRR